MVTVIPYERTDDLTSMPYPEYEPGTYGEAVGSPAHYISWSAPEYYFGLKIIRIYEVFFLDKNIKTIVEM